MLRLRIWFLLPLAGIIWYSVLTLGSTPSNTHSVLPPLTRYVKAVPVKNQPAVRTAHFQGVIEARDQATLAPTVGGRILTRPVRVGDAVSKGALIAAIDPQPFRLAQEQAQSKVQQVEAQLTQAMASKTRADRLLEAKAITAAEWEAAIANEEALKAVLAEARAWLAETERQVTETQVRAPFSGEITAIHAEPGEFAGPGFGIVSLSGLKALEITVQVPESLISSIALGQSYQITFPFLPNHSVEAEVSHLGNAGVGSNLFPVRLTLPEDKAIRAGNSAIVHLTFRDDASVAVPVSAVINPGSTQPLVLKINQGVVLSTPVEVHQLRQGWVSVGGALVEGDLVVVSDHAGLLDGDAVEVVQ